VTHVVPAIATCASVAGIVVALAGYRLAGRQARVGLRQEARELAAAVVAELVDVKVEAETVAYALAVTNVGRGVARDVDIAFVRWSDSTRIAEVIAEQAVAVALRTGETREIAVAVPLADVAFDDRSVAIELTADYYDDVGARNDRLALVLEDGLVQLPPSTLQAA
jgi:hypothetical protein